MKPLSVAAAACVALSACALKGDVRRVERQLVEQRQQAARADSARAADLHEMLALQRRILDTLMAQQTRLAQLATFQGDVRTELTGLQRELAQVKELISATQQRLSAMDRGASRVATPGGAPGGAQGTPEADQLFRSSQQLLGRGSRSTAREGFQKFLTDYPTHLNVPLAIYFIGESFDPEQPDSASAYYERVVKDHHGSAKAPTALYKLGLLNERAGKLDIAKAYYQRVLTEYPNSTEAPTARENLAKIGR